MLLTCSSQSISAMCQRVHWVYKSRRKGTLRLQIYSVYRISLSLLCGYNLIKFARIFAGFLALSTHSHGEVNISCSRTPQMDACVNNLLCSAVRERILCVSTPGENEVLDHVSRRKAAAQGHGARWLPERKVHDFRRGASGARVKASLSCEFKNLASRG